MMEEYHHRSVERTRDSILHAAAENSELLNQLAKSEEAPGLFAAHQKVVEATRNELFEQEVSLRRLKQSTDEQFYAHKKLRDSRFRRTYYRATRMLEKFEAKAMKEERDYFDTLSKQSKAEDRERSLKHDLEEAEAALPPLEKLARAHGEIHLKIDTLYEKLFAGPTPGFAYEDDKEHAFHNAKDINDATKENIIGARRALKLLNQATSNLTRADTYARYALQDASNSIFFFDEALSLLQHCNIDIDHGLNAVTRASKLLGTLTPEMQAVKMGIMGALQAAKSSTRASYDGRDIAENVYIVRAKLEEAQNKVKVMTDQTKAREGRQLKDIRTTARVLEESRQALEEVRQGIFEDVAGFGEAAPAYNYCCDRTDWHCAIPPPESQDEDIFNQPHRPTPAEVAAQVAQQRKQHVQHGPEQQGTSDGLGVPLPSYDELQSSNRGDDALLSPRDGQSGPWRTADALNSLGPEIPS